MPVARSKSCKSDRRQMDGRTEHRDLLLLPLISDDFLLHSYYKQATFSIITLQWGVEHNTSELLEKASYTGTCSRSQPCGEDECDVFLIFKLRAIVNKEKCHSDGQVGEM